MTEPIDKVGAQNCHADTSAPQPQEAKASSEANAINTLNNANNLPPELITQFANLFRGYPYAYGEFPLTGSDERGKATGRPRTIKGQVTFEHYARHLRGEVPLGIIPLNENNCCSFAAIDIDDIGIDLYGLQQACGELPVVICRSKSGGAHVYVFFDEPVPAVLVRDQLLQWAAALGYPRAEIFPKQTKRDRTDDVGNWINLPYFNAERTNRYAI